MAALRTLPSLTDGELAQVAGDLTSVEIRERILLGAVPLLTQVTLPGTGDIILQAATKREELAALLFAKYRGLQGLELASLVGRFEDGRVRDLLIAQGIRFLKVLNAEGAAQLVLRSFDRKVEVALLGVRLILNFRGSDLERILKACGSGDTRDRILLGSD